MKKINLKEMFKTLAIALIFATIFRTFFFQPFAIPSGSMIPTLIIGDRLLVEKFSYGYSKYSFPLNMIPFSGKILDIHKPKRGQIVVFKRPEKGNEYFIKRVMGLPGDKIAVKKGIVHVNGKANHLEYIREDDINIGKYKLSAYMYKETNVDGYSYFIYKLSKDAKFIDDNFAEVIIPDGHYFMMGDNRNNSSDSRFEDMGFIPSDKIIGKARILFFSSSAHLYEIHKFKDEIYWNRMLKRLDKST